VKIGVVIPTHNRKEALRRVLTQLATQHLDHRTQIIAVVVVDGSTDGTLEMLRSTFPEVRVVKGNGDWWYTKSMNMGFKYLVGHSVDRVLTFNDDCEIENNYIKTLVDASREVEGESIIGSIGLTAGSTHRIFFSGVKSVDWRLYRSEVYHAFLEPCDPSTLTGLHPSVLLPGRGMLIPMKVLKSLDYFDEIFPQYGSDDDFCLRAIARNIRVYVSWDARVFSEPGGTGNGSYFVTQPFPVFLRSFLQRSSRTYIKKEVVRLWRHGNPVFFPIALAIMIRKHFTGYFFGPKVRPC
jgi:GT2 family glycosyltransferase